MLYVIVMGAVHADEKVLKQKRGLLSQGLSASGLESQGHSPSGAYQYQAPSIGLSQGTHNHVESFAPVSSSHVHIDNLPSVSSSYQVPQYNQLVQVNSVNAEVSAAQEHINSAQLNNYAGYNSAASAETAAAQSHLNNANLGNTLSGQYGGQYAGQYAAVPQYTDVVAAAPSPVQEVAVQVPVDRPYPVEVPRAVHIRVPVRIEHQVQVKIKKKFLHLFLD